MVVKYIKHGECRVSKYIMNSCTQSMHYIGLRDYSKYYTYIFFCSSTTIYVKEFTCTYIANCKFFRYFSIKIVSI